MNIDVAIIPGTRDVTATCERIVYTDDQKYVSRLEYYLPEFDNLSPNELAESFIDRSTGKLRCKIEASDKRFEGTKFSYYRIYSDGRVSSLCYVLSGQKTLLSIGWGNHTVEILLDNDGPFF